MKKCTYCGTEYPDDATVCATDQTPLESNAPAPRSEPAVTRPPTPVGGLFSPQKLRVMHLYLGCIFAPMLLFFAISGIWQTLGFHSSLLQRLSTIHTSHNLKIGGFTSFFMMIFVVIMALSFIFSTVLGVVMAFKQTRNRRAALYCLGFGIAFPLVLILIPVFMRITR